MDCLFCKIVAGAIPNYTVYQDDFVLAFLDIHPCASGHTVVIPKQHFSDLFAVDMDSWRNTMVGLKKTVERLYHVLQPAGMNIGINDRPAAGQAVGHVHWHLIPRYPGDGGGSMHSIVRSQSAQAAAELAKLFI